MTIRAKKEHSLTIEDRIKKHSLILVHYDDKKFFDYKKNDYRVICSCNTWIEENDWYREESTQSWFTYAGYDETKPCPRLSLAIKYNNVRNKERREAMDGNKRFQKKLRPNWITSLYTEFLIKTNNKPISFQEYSKECKEWKS